MPTSINDADVRVAFETARVQRAKQVLIDGKPVDVPTPFPSPEDWRDQWIYFLMVDRFNNPQAPPRFAPFDGMHGVFQGGTLNGGKGILEPGQRQLMLAAASPFLLVRNRATVDDVFPS
jgi:hypothetical protein